MDEDVLVMEADLAGAISFTKGCYLGQEVVERVTARGHVNRRRTGLVFSAEPVASRTTLRLGGREVGWVTSCVRSPRLARTIGMGYVRREQLEPGTVLEVAGGGQAEVAALPFHRGGQG
jgi:folate-binding protein YgfZ